MNAVVDQQLVDDDPLVARNVEGLIIARLEGRAGPQVENRRSTSTPRI